MVSTAPATADRWDDLLAVMGTRGDPSRCWCQWFRHQRPGYAARSRDQRRDDLHTELGESPPPGVLAYADDGTPVGWCAVAPRADYPRLLSYPAASSTADEPGLWSVTCFVVRVGHRRQGLSTVLLDAAVALVREHGGTVVEAYPMDTSVRDTSAPELFHGPLSVFLAAGFREVGERRTKARPVVRLTL